jgi:hypothetical protein
MLTGATALIHSSFSGNRGAWIVPTYRFANVSLSGPLLW